MYEFDLIQPDPKAVALLTPPAMGPQVQGMAVQYHILELHTRDIPATHLTGSHYPPLTHTLHIDLLILPQMKRTGGVVARHLTPDVPAVPSRATGLSHWAQCLQLLQVQIHQVGNLPNHYHRIVQALGLLDTVPSFHTIPLPFSVD